MTIPLHVERMIMTLAEITHKKDGCKQYETVCTKRFNGMLKNLKTVSDCYDCIKEEFLKGQTNDNKQR